MIKTILTLLMLFLLSETNNKDLCLENNFKTIEVCDFDWTIIGAGVSGIATVSVLLQSGILPDRILWVDDEFKVGRLSNYTTVIANNKSKFFIKFLESCSIFTECVPNAINNLLKLDQEKEYSLSYIVEPLQDITNCLLKKVKSNRSHLMSLDFENNSWKVGIKDKTISSYNVILATGSHPKSLNYEEYKSKEIHLDNALNKSYLEKIVTATDIVGVVGASHSGILILKYLSEMPVKQIINFYNKPILYPIDMGTWTLNDESGIKGVAAEWAKNVLEKNPPKNLLRLESKPEILKENLEKCTRIIYAIGFERNELPNIKENTTLNYDAKTGVIAPRLFGIGIAFPEENTNPVGITEYKVGLNSFIDYAQRVIPCWLQKRGIKYRDNQYILTISQFDKLFNIEIL